MLADQLVNSVGYLAIIIMVLPLAGWAWQVGQPSSVCLASHPG
jgi:hypothetical protein